MALEKEKASEKVRTICRIIEEETLNPAKKEAEDIVSQARREASEIVLKAKKEAEDELAKCDAEIEKKKRIFDSSLEMAVKQSIAYLKQEVTENFFSKALRETIKAETSSPSWIAKLLDALVEGLKKDGIATELQAVVPRTVSKEEILKSITQEVAKSLEASPEKALHVGDIDGGVEVKLVEHNFALSVSDEALRQIVAKYVHRDLKSKVYQK